MFKNDLKVDNKQADLPRIVEEELATTRVTNVAGVVTEIGDERVTSRAEQIRHDTDEAMVWQSSPSLTLMIAPLVAALFFFAISVVAYVELRSYLATIALSSPSVSVVGSQHKVDGRRPVRREATPQATYSPTADPAQVIGVAYDVLLCVGVLLALALLIEFIKLKTTRYSATSQRLIVEKGLLVARSQPYEPHRLGNAVIKRPLILRPFGVANVEIAGPALRLRGVRNADYVRDILRTGGQLEAQRIDKIRWR